METALTPTLPITNYNVAMKGKISARARNILADRKASDMLMNYVVRGKEGTLELGRKKYSVKTTSPKATIARNAASGRFTTKSTKR